jgi:hypothetical protein
MKVRALSLLLAASFVPLMPFGCSGGGGPTVQDPTGGVATEKAAIELPTKGSPALKKKREKMGTAPSSAQ